MKKKIRPKNQLLLRKALIKAESINRLAAFIGVSRQRIQHWKKKGVSKRGKELLEIYLK